MESTNHLLEGVDLVWWPTLLRNMAGSPASGAMELSDCELDSFSASLERLAAALALPDVPVSEEVTLP